MINSKRIARCILPNRIYTRLTWDGYHGGFDKYKCIFIHIPKAAGSSISLSLFGHQVMHRSASEYYFNNPKKFKDYYKFSFVRNPWDRLVSAYFYLKGGGMDPRDKAWSEANLSPFSSFESFVKGWVNKENIVKKNHFTPQYLYLNNGDPNSRIILVDYVGRFENLEKDFVHVCEVLGITRQLSVTNTSKRSHYQDYYDDEMIRIVRDVYDEDIELFGYKF